ncbi:MAG: rRNA adenine N-6-methyltransferase family protein, partial [bacterium]|nr:rRNA adenine N-6-methyltransferase family protein [bacterium]
MRSRLVAEILEDVQWTSKRTGRKDFDPKVMAAMGKVPRHEFVPKNLQAHAYENRPLPIGYGQTISQPYIVALMTDLLDLRPGDRALEIGTGSGYQAAILSEIIKDVFTIEIIPQLGKQAQARLNRLGYKNIKTKVGDGYYGWKQQAP